MPIFSFTLKNRLRDPKIFDLLFQKGERIFSKHYIFFYLPNNQEIARLGIVISKRKCRLSVHRSYLRRLIREQFRLNKNELAGFDILVLLKNQIKDPKDAAVQNTIKNQFAKLLAIHKSN